MLPVRWTNSICSGISTVDDLKDFIWTMIYTGLRISDVALFDMKRFEGARSSSGPGKTGAITTRQFPTG